MVTHYSITESSTTPGNELFCQDIASSCAFKAQLELLFCVYSAWQVVYVSSSERAVEVRLQRGATSWDQRGMMNQGPESRLEALFSFNKETDGC